jgi:hypothetical protein
MTQSLLCYRVFKVVRHPQCHGEDLPQLVDLPRGCHRLRYDSGRLQVHASRALPSRIQVSIPALLPHRRVKVTDCHHYHGELHLEGRHHCPLWITSVEDTALAYFHATTVRQAYAKIGFVCILDNFAFLTH